MDIVELTNIKMVDGSDQKPTSDQDANVRMTGASNPAYVPDRDEHANKVRLLLGLDNYVHRLTGYITNESELTFSTRASLYDDSSYLSLIVSTYMYFIAFFVQNGWTTSSSNIR